MKRNTHILHDRNRGVLIRYPDFAWHVREILCVNFITESGNKDLHISQSSRNNCLMLLIFFSRSLDFLSIQYVNVIFLFPCNTTPMFWVISQFLLYLINHCLVLKPSDLAILAALCKLSNSCFENQLQRCRLIECLTVRWIDRRTYPRITFIRKNHVLAIAIQLSFHPCESVFFEQ